MQVPLLYDSHMHTPLCKHARGKPEEYAAAAERRGLAGIIFTCHNPGPVGWSTNVRMKMEQFDQYRDMVMAARSRWEGRIDVRLGLECDYMPGFESWLEPFLDTAGLDYTLGSVHPQLPYYKNAHYTGDVREYYRLYFEHQALAAETGLFDTLAHPDLVKNVFPKLWHVDSVLDDIRMSLDRIAKSGAAMELNTSGLHKEIREMNPTPVILEEMSHRGIPIVLGSDAHVPQRVGADFDRALRLLMETGHEHIYFYGGEQMQQVGLEDAVASLTAMELVAAD